MSDNNIGYAVCVHGSKPRFFTGLMQGAPVLSTKGEDMHVFPTASAAEVMRLLVEERTGKHAEVIEVMEGVRIDG